MKKNNSHLANDEIDLGDLIKSLWREKVLILSITIICGLAGYLYASFEPQEFTTEIKFKNPPTQIFDSYNLFTNNTNNRSNSKNNSLGQFISDNIFEQFISDFKLNFLSLDNLESFIEKSREFDNFKAYLKSRNISAQHYFVNRFGEVKEKNLIIENKYFLVFTKELEGDIFLYNYSQFIKKKTVFEIKEKLKLSAINRILTFENALENAKLINLENPILSSMNQTNQVVHEPEDLFYKGSKILSQEISYLKKLLIKLENDQFNFEAVIDKPLNSPVKKVHNLTYFAIGLMLGLFLSVGIIFFRDIFKNN
jgi:LPS O-antigen subunit length determinant protein (WzzB/FepE family)